MHTVEQTDRSVDRDRPAHRPGRPRQARRARIVRSIWSRRWLPAVLAAAVSLPLVPARVASATPATTTALISRSAPPESKQGPSQSDSPSQSTDGQWSAFVSRNALDPASGTTTSQVYLRSRSTQEIKWVSDMRGVPGAPGGGDPHFYEASEPSVSSDGHLIAFTARRPNTSIHALSQPDMDGTTPRPQTAGDLQVVLEEWFPGEVLKIRVTDSDGACGSVPGDSMAFAGTPTLGSVSPSGPQITLSLASSGPGCGNNEVDLHFADGGAAIETITLTAIKYVVGSGVALNAVSVTTVPAIDGSGSPSASNATLKSGGGNSITADSRPTITTATPESTGQAGNLTIHLSGWTDEVINVFVTDSNGATCSLLPRLVAVGSVLIGGVGFSGTLRAAPKAPNGPTAEVALIDQSCGTDANGHPRGNAISVHITNSGTGRGDLTIGNIAYAVGSHAAVGDVRVTTSPVLANSGQAAASNATIAAPTPTTTPSTPPPSTPTTGVTKLGDRTSPSITLIGFKEQTPSGTASTDPACTGGCQVYVRDMVAKTTRLVSAQDVPTPPKGGPPPWLPLGGNNHAPSINQDGTQIAFVSTACGLGAGECRGSSTPAVLVRDAKDPSTPRTVIVSVPAGGSRACDLCFSDHPSISADGRFVAFSSNESLTPRAGGTQVYLHDRDVTGSGRFDQGGVGLTSTRLISARPDPLAPSDGASQPSISGDGRLVAFVSSDGALAPTANAQGTQVYVHDRFADAGVNLVDIRAPADPLDRRWTFEFDEPVGATGSTLAADHFKLIGSGPPIGATKAVIGNGGTTVTVTMPGVVDPSTVARGVVLPGAVAFPLTVPNPMLTTRFGTAIAGPDLTSVGPSTAAPALAVRFSFDVPVTAANPDRFELFDRTGAVFSASGVTQVGTSSVDATFTQAQLHTAVGADVRAGAVAGGQEAQLLAPFQPFTVLASRSPNGPGDGASDHPSISGDGRTVAFSSMATNLAGAKPTPKEQHNIYAHDLASGDTQVLSVSSAGARADGNSYRPSTSGNGRFVAFESDATNLDADSNRGVTDVFLSDRFPALALSPGPGNFGAVSVGSSSNPVTFTVTNHGAGPAVLGTASITGTDAADFTAGGDTCSGVTLYPQSPGNTCVVTVVFSPGADGGRSATLQVTSDAPLDPVTDQLSGTGTIPAVTLTPAPVDFGSVPLGAATTAIVTVTDTGTAPARISTVGLTGGAAGDFSVVSDGCSNKTLAPTDSCQVILRFAATAFGSRNAILTVKDNAKGSPHADPLTGTGLAAPKPPPPPPPTSTPQLQIQPKSGPPGSLVTVIGTGWAKNQNVVVSWSTGLEGKAIVTADANGTFVTVMAVLRHDFLGWRQAVATQAAGPNPTTRTQPFLAVPGTTEPPGFVLRR